MRLDAGACVHANHLCARRALWRVFALASRLGDGPAWYALMLALPVLYGWTGLVAAVQLACTGLFALALYRVMKRATRRPRPFAADRRIRAWVAPLDEFSFPSGHTLHAVAFTIVAVGHVPPLAWVLLPFTATVAASRVVLGLHYPSDVIAATAIGTVLGLASMALVPA
jgi:undecaprenyl-diphosphatase